MKCPVCEHGIVRFSNEEKVANCIACNAVFAVRLECVKRYPTQKLIDRKTMVKKQILAKRDKKEKPPVFSFED